MLHPGSLLTAGFVAVFAVFLFLLQTLVMWPSSETRSLHEVAKASVRPGVEINRVNAHNPYMRTER
jgi:hypothetical protein